MAASTAVRLYNERERVRARLLEAITFSQTVHRKDNNFEYWHRREMEDLLSHINWERAQLDKDPITMRVLLRTERHASGHSDYTRKLALYAAELVIPHNEGESP